MPSCRPPLPSPLLRAPIAPALGAHVAVRGFRPLLIVLVRRQARPELEDAGSAGGQHTVLQAVQVLAVDGRHEAPRDEAEEDTGRDVVFADAVAELAVLVEHVPEAEGDGLVKAS